MLVIIYAVYWKRYFRVYSHWSFQISGIFSFEKPFKVLVFYSRVLQDLFCGCHSLNTAYNGVFLFVTEVHTERSSIDVEHRTIAGKNLVIETGANIMDETVRICEIGRIAIIFFHQKCTVILR